MTAERRSTYELIGLPETFGVVLLTFGLVLALSPFFSGVDFGIFQVPAFDTTTVKTLRIAGPAVFIVLVALLTRLSLR